MREVVQRKVTRQEWAFLAAVGALVAMIASFVRGEIAWAGLSASTAVGSWVAARRWNRETPVPFPYAYRWFLHLPRPMQSPKQLAAILEPQRGEHLLEIGPGIGTHALRIASGVGPEGTVELVDVQREMLDGIEQRAHSRGIENLATRQGDAAHLPYPDQTFDGAYLISVLGEIPDGDGALRELHRVLRPAGRLVVGEVFVDPDFVSLRHLKERARKAGFTFDSKAGNALAYLARFDRVVGGVR